MRSPGPDGRRAPGNYLVIGHGASGIQADTVAEMAERYNEHSAVAFIPRTKEEVTRFFTGLEIIPPGLSRASVAGKRHGHGRIRQGTRRLHRLRWCRT